MPKDLLDCLKKPNARKATITRGGKRILICKDSKGWHRGEPHKTSGGVKKRSRKNNKTRKNVKKKGGGKKKKV